VSLRWARVQVRRMGAPPEFVEPMAALNTAKLPEGEQWIYEVKWDGYRAWH
jgi:ATP-dependent DNA ligase